MNKFFQQMLAYRTSAEISDLSAAAPLYFKTKLTQKSIVNDKPIIKIPNK